MMPACCRFDLSDVERGAFVSSANNCVARWFASLPDRCGRAVPRIRDLHCSRRPLTSFRFYQHENQKTPVYVGAAAHPN